MKLYVIDYQVIETLTASAVVEAENEEAAISFVREDEGSATLKAAAGKAYREVAIMSIERSS